MRPRQPLPFAGAGLPVLPTLVTEETGIARFECVDQSKVELPSVETTDLRACLDAGVNLKHVNTKLFGAKEIVTDLSVESQEIENNEEEGNK